MDFRQVGLGGLMVAAGAVVGYLLQPRGLAPSVNELARVWKVTNATASPFSCDDKEVEPCHFGPRVGHEDDDKDSSWLIIVTRAGECPDQISPRFALVAIKNVQVGDLPRPEPVGFGSELCPVPKEDFAVQGNVTFVHGGSVAVHSVKLTLEGTYHADKPYRVAIDMKEVGSGTHLHNGTGHAED